MGMFHGVKIYSDHFTVYPDRFNLNRKRIFKLWLTLVKIKGRMTTPEFIEAFSYK